MKKAEKKKEHKCPRCGAIMRTKGWNSTYICPVCGYPLRRPFSYM